MSDLVAWRTDEKIAADIDRRPRRWLSVGMSRKRLSKDSPVVMNYCIFVLEEQQAQDILGLDLAQFSTELVRVTLKLEVLPETLKAPGVTV